MSPWRSRSGGELDAGDGEAIKEVVAEAPLLDLAIEVAARGGDHPHVDLDPAVASHAPHLGPLEARRSLG